MMISKAKGTKTKGSPAYGAVFGKALPEDFAFSESLAKGSGLENIARMLRYLRERDGLQQKDVAAKVDRTMNHISMIETAKRKPSPELLYSLVDALSKSKEENAALRNYLFNQLAKEKVPSGVRIMESPLPGLSSEAMPKKLIDRVKEDIGKGSQGVTRAARAAGVSKEDIESFLAGRLTLTRAQIASLASEYKQPGDEYLVLAGYIPLPMYKLMTNPATGPVLGSIIKLLSGSKQPEIAVEFLKRSVESIESLSSGSGGTGQKKKAI